jgi:hypothetical protein
MSILDDVVDYGLAPGNHDMSNAGVALRYDRYFSACRYQGKPWYGGGYRNNKNNFQLFSVGTLDFLVLHLEWEPTDDVLDWAGDVLDAHPGRRVIVSTHKYLNDLGERAGLDDKKRSTGNCGEEIWQKLIRSHCDVFMVVNGHYHWPPGYGESRLTSTNDCGNEVHQILQNYQNEPWGGNGWLRYYTFEPSRNAIEAYTYSVTLDQYQTDEASRFTLDYDMGAEPFEIIAVNDGVSSGSRTEAIWGGLEHLTEYEWYVTVDDGSCVTTGPAWRFVTEQDCSDPPPVDPSCDGVDNDCDGATDEDYVPAPTACGLGECSGNTGELLCESGSHVDTCDPFLGATEEICDGLDNDCDGATDEDFPVPSVVFNLLFLDR